MNGYIHPKVTDDYVYFDTTFKVGQEYYSGAVNIEQNAKGRRLKDITKIRNITQDIRGSYGETPATTILHDVSTHSMPQESSGDNGDFSLKGQSWGEGQETTSQDKEARVTKSSPLPPLSPTSAPKAGGRKNRTAGCRKTEYR